MRRYLYAMGLVCWLPAAVGVAARHVVDGYRGEGSWLLWLGLAFYALAWGWGKISDRCKAAPAVTISTIYDWVETEEGVEFYARREDGSEHQFAVNMGATVTRTEKA